ncbi:hypothetical protein Emag_000006 [Eimeria magna]
MQRDTLPSGGGVLHFYQGEAECSPCGGTFACPTPSTKTYCFTPYTVALPDNPTECVPCPAGHSCKDGIVQRCPDFHYSRLGDGFCRLCKGGYLCKGGAEAPDEGDLVPIGYYRSDIDTTLHPCPNGTLGSIAGATTEATCSSCPAGYMCEMSDVGGEYPRAVPQPCPAGYVCLPERVPCPARTRSPGTDVLSFMPIFWLTVATTVKTPLRSLTDMREITSLASRRDIFGPAFVSLIGGHILVALAFWFVDSYQPKEGSTDTECRPCPAGTYGAASCPAGTTHPDNLDRGTGWFSMEAYASCISCPEKYTCAGGGVPTAVTA